jgi:hypothetical protein
VAAATGTAGSEGLPPGLSVAGSDERTAAAGASEIFATGIPAGLAVGRAVDGSDNEGRELGGVPVVCNAVFGEAAGTVDADVFGAAGGFADVGVGPVPDGAGAPCSGECD